MRNYLIDGLIQAGPSLFNIKESTRLINIDKVINSQLKIIFLKKI